MKILGVVLDRRLTFVKHVMAVARSCNYHVQAIRHIRHLLSTDLATTRACSLILSRLDYCNSLLHGAPTSSISTLQRVQNNAARIILQAPRCSHARPLLHQLHWLPVHHRIDYKLAVMTYKIHRSSTPAYLSRHIKLLQSARSLRSSDVPLLDKPIIRTEFAKRYFRYFAPSVWNSLPTQIVNSNSLTAFKSRLKSHFLPRCIECRAV